MGIYIYCPVASTGARDLANTLKAKRVKKLPFLKKGDLLVMWGACLIGIQEGVKVLNNIPGIKKLTELQRLEKGGVKVPPFSPSPKEGFLARSSNHQGGKDLLAGKMHGDFYVKKLPLEKEFRVHVFGGKSIRLGMKVPRDGFGPGGKKLHPWIRSYDGGWRLSYGQQAQAMLPQGVRPLAKKAIEVLGLDFGAVDMGVTAQGEIYVLEVNRRPGIEGKSLEVYAKHIQGLVG